jgi:microcystin-dependent protein
MTEDGGPTGTHSGGGGETRDTTVATENLGGGQDGETVPHENMPPYLSINWIIKA